MVAQRAPHQSLITYSRDALQSVVGDRYFVSIGKRVYVEHREVFLEISDAVSEERIVTVIEVLSPANKRPGPGRDLYLRKQAEILTSTTNLVEIDLLRDGDPTVAVPSHRRRESAYGVVVSRAADRFRRELYPIRLLDRLPRVAIPLEEGHPAAVLDLQAVLDESYEKGGFGRRIDSAGPRFLPWARATRRGRSRCWLAPESPAPQTTGA